MLIICLVNKDKIIYSIFLLEVAYIERKIIEI